MMDGQKVVKVFCHEEENIEKFKEINNNLYESAYNANAFANVIGPINAQLGNMSYVVCAIVGGALALQRRWLYARWSGKLSDLQQEF